MMEYVTMSGKGVHQPGSWLGGKSCLVNELFACMKYSKCHFSIIVDTNASIMIESYISTQNEIVFENYLILMK